MSRRTPKPTPKRTAAPRRTPRNRRAPTGLVALFNAMQGAGYVQEHGPNTPDIYAATIPALLKCLHGNDRRFVDTILAAAAEYPVKRPVTDGFGPDGTQTASEVASITAISGFWSGVAVAWHVLNAINGKDGAQ